MTTAIQQKAMPDLTRLRDPASIWPDPHDCPDWPYSQRGERRGFIPSRDNAEATLANHIEAMHGKDAVLRAPNKAEIEAAMGRYFTAREPGTSSGKVIRWDALGFKGLNKTTADFEDFAARIVESTHIRGYLRKLDAQAELSEALQVDRNERALKAKVDQYTRVRDDHLSELDLLAEAEARHLQAEADKLAHARCVELRRTLRIRYADAESAATELGATVPELPELRYDG